MMDVKKGTAPATAASSTTGSTGSSCMDATSPPPLHPFLMHQLLNNAVPANSTTTNANTAATATSVSTAAQQLLQNYALVATSVANGTGTGDLGSSRLNTSSSPNSLPTSQPSTDAGSSHSFWDSSQSLLGSNGLVMTPQNANDQSFATAASQLLATISAQMAKESKGSLSSTDKLFCLMCGQTSRDSMDYEQHLLSHFSLLDPSNNQKIYQYGMHFLQMQNLLNSNSNSQQNPNNAASVINNGLKTVSNSSNIPSPNPTNSSGSTITSSISANIMTKKRKLLSSHHSQNESSTAVESINKQIIGESSSETNGNEPDHNTKSGANVQSTSAAVSAFPCTSCHKTFATEVDLKAHLIRHLTQHPFVCFSCGKGFKYEHSLNFHVKSYHSGNSNNSSKSISEKNLSKSKDLKCSENAEQETVLPLKLKRKSSSTSCSSEEKKSKQISLSTESLNDPLKSSTFMAPTLITDENHNQTTARSFNWSNPDLTYFYGKPPTNLPPDSPIQIRAEKILISILDAVNVATEQSMLFYKCCLCCVAFPTLDQMNLHVQNIHHLMNADLGTVLSLNSDHQQKQQNVATAAAAAAMTALLAKSTMDDTKLSSPTSSSTSSSMTGTGSNFYQCDKCLAKFNEPIEYEIHSQLHRTLEMASSLPGSGLHSNSTAEAAAAAAANQYQFQLLNSLMVGGSTTTKTSSQSNCNPTVVDFRKILANTSKNTDFGRKFAAHLLEGSQHHQQQQQTNTTGSSAPINSSKEKPILTGNSGDNNFPPSVHDSCSPPLSLMPAIISTGSSVGTPQLSGKQLNSDNNNNSLLYLSGIVPSEAVVAVHAHGHQQSKSKTSKCSIDALNLSGTNEIKCSSPSTKSSANKLLNGSKNSGSSSSSSSSTGSISSRHLKEPVDIFEGAGQSLPIQKFPLGDIEETAPGQFKCRFCDKTFDRVFSVHRHERVHTGFKPCVCKTCGRGFSEKRNLRHHIIRFHSDGSGRELLKRKRKPKNGSGFDGGGSNINNQQQDAAIMMIQQQQKQQSPLLLNGPSSEKLSSSAFMSSLLSSAAGSLLAGAFQFNNGTSGQPEPGSLSNLKLSLAEMNRIKSSSSTNRGRKQNHDEDDPGSDENLSLMKMSNNNEAINLSSCTTINPGGGSSRRRKSKPSKKVVSQDEDEEKDDEREGTENKRELITADVDVHEDEYEIERELEQQDQNKQRDQLNEKQLKDKEPDGEETEEEDNKNEVNSDTEPEIEQQKKEVDKSSSKSDKKKYPRSKNQRTKQNKYSRRNNRRRSTS